MPTTTIGTTDETVYIRMQHDADYDSADVQEEELEEEDLQTQAPMEFELQQNTQAILLRELRQNYPQTIFSMNYRLSPREALESNRNEIRTAIGRVRRFQAARCVYELAPSKLKREVKNFIIGALPSRQSRVIADGEESAQDYEDELMSLVVDRMRVYKNAYTEYVFDQERYLPLQADYTQRAALIRQQPNNHLTINCQHIVNTVSQWENVWGIATQIDETNNVLKIRVGLSDIVMHESAIDTRYDYRAEILLAPFFFTIVLDNNGRFQCPSANRNVVGLSRVEAGSSYYDFHPHQLSDTPCFGSFGQTFIDMAAKGDVVSLIGGIIAFYSQYNSQDSAGISAQYYHPAHISLFSNEESYVLNLRSGITTSYPYYNFNRDKLTEAINRYKAYHSSQRNVDPPEQYDRWCCASCDEADVSDGTEYWVTAADERVCSDCWHEHYCNECERYIDDCNCGEPEEY